MVYTLLASPRRKSSPDEDTMRSGSPPPLDTVTAANDPGFTPEELADALDLPWSIVHDAVEMDKYPIRTDVYRLWARAIHVFSEARRVVQFRALCEQFNRTRIPEPTSTSVVELYQQLGDLMNSSQVSCRDRFQCSCSELDQLVKICREAGAIGSRLTGAGWGGCTVSLVPADQVDHFMARVKMNYYQARFPELVSQDQLGNVLFATQPGPPYPYVNEIDDLLQHPTC
ncbi:galactokinase [Dispira parvispora]|uniref:Galactokinase n=1 Tax=Dispira parvispora TaxID=1520584 RepID=A0A9W8AIT5_9FUNG|nr:galactokinase [Dispira parvispora]